MNAQAKEHARNADEARKQFRKDRSDAAAENRLKKEVEARDAAKEAGDRIEQAYATLRTGYPAWVPARKK